MKSLEIVYFVEPGRIYPFIKEKGEGHREYYALSKLKQELEESSDSNVEGKQLLVGIKANRYLDFFMKGYSYFELDSLFNEAYEKLASRRIYSEMEEFYLEKEAMNIAYRTYQSYVAVKQLVKKI